MKIQRGIVKVCNIKCILNCKFWGPAGPPDFVIALKMYQNPSLHIVFVFVSDTKGSRKKTAFYGQATRKTDHKHL